MKLTKWEMFYTDSKNNEDLVDQISIDADNKRYVLDIDAEDWVTDGEDENGNEIYSNYVSRYMFDLILKAIKENGFVELKAEE